LYSTRIFLYELILLPRDINSFTCFTTVLLTFICTLVSGFLLNPYTHCLVHIYFQSLSLVFYADDANLLGDNTDTIKKNTNFNWC
jgi:hypothetical protein